MPNGLGPVGLTIAGLGGEGGGGGGDGLLCGEAAYLFGTGFLG